MDKKRTSLSLEEKLAGIGVMTATRRLSKQTIAKVDVEETIADAVVAFSSASEDLRWLGPALAWVREHGAAVILEKLTKILQRHSQAGNSIDYVALLARFAIEHGHKRWRPLITLAPKVPKLVGAPELAHSLIKIRGEEMWAREVGFLVPRGSLSAESKWVLSRSALARANLQYRNRLVYGAQWRADIITAIERGAQTPTEASRVSGASYEPCHRVFSELTAAGVLDIRRAG